MGENKHYIRLDSNNFIVCGFSDAFEVPIESDICINEDGERQFEINGQINPSLIDIQGRYNYKFEDNKVVMLTEEEKTTLFPTPAPQATADEILRAKLIKDNASIQLQLVAQQKLNADILLKIAKLGGATNA